MKFRWDETNIRRAILLAGEGFTATEAATAMGTTRCSLACRSSRKKEFRFHPQKPGYKVNSDAFNASVARARDLIGEKAPHTAAGPAKRAMVPAIPTGRPTAPQVCRAYTLVEAPLNETERLEVIADEGSTESSVLFSDMGAKDCRWIVGKDEFGEALVCGKRIVQGKPYCSEHAAKAVSAKQPRPISPKAAALWDQSTRLVEVKK